MPRLRNSKTGVVANVDEATAATLGPEWEPTEEKSSSRKTSSKSASAKKSD